MIKFNTTNSDAYVIALIARQAVNLAEKHNGKYLFSDAEMDITACHANGCVLKLTELYGADDFNFGHDVFGIRRHLNRETGKLENYFSPRFSV